MSQTMPAWAHVKAIVNGLALFMAAAFLPAWAAPQFDFHAPPAAADASTPAIMRDLADRLLPVYQEPDPDR